mgnify:CR=1 FL=1|tara:strand:- start:3782 stop:3976 length:195 start_codon:yes stop_codon:yes gene_type:complete
MTDDFCDVYDFVAIKAAVEDAKQENTIEGEIYDILDILLDGLDMEDRVRYLQITLAKNLGSNDN